MNRKKKDVNSWLDCIYVFIVYLSHPDNTKHCAPDPSCPPDKTRVFMHYNDFNVRALTFVKMSSSKMAFVTEYMSWNEVVWGALSS